VKGCLAAGAGNIYNVEAWAPFTWSAVRCFSG